ncbi:Hint domain-containing protein [Chloroflexota bacterium]
MKKLQLLWSIVLISLITITVGACTEPPSEPLVTYSIPELKYMLLGNFDNVFYVDSDYYPIAREGQEEQNALEQYSEIKADDAEFTAIINHLEIPSKGEYSVEEKLLIYREHKILTRAVQLTINRDRYNFALRVGEGQGELIEGTITNSGEIKVLKREESFNTYPICLAKGTRIETSEGPVLVELVHKGMLIWTVDDSGSRVLAPVTKTVNTLVPSSFRVVKVELSDSRTITASQNHPTADNKALGNYEIGDTLDGAQITSIEYLPYTENATYDILPAGLTGLYWANGILLKSTLTK